MNINPGIAQAKAALNKNLAVTQRKLAKRTHERDEALARIAAAEDRAELAERSARDVSREHKRLRDSHDALVKALTDLSNMYSHAWDCVDGNLVMLGSSIERFEKAHHAAQVALCAVTGAPLPISDEDMDDPVSEPLGRDK